MNKWKIIAITFIIITILLILLTFFGLKYGKNIVEKENKCAYNICKDYDSFYFDSRESVCYCGKEEVEYEEKIK